MLRKPSNRKAHQRKKDLLLNYIKGQGGSTELSLKDLGRKWGCDESRLLGAALSELESEGLIKTAPKRFGKYGYAWLHNCEPPKFKTLMEDRVLQLLPDDGSWSDFSCRKLAKMVDVACNEKFMNRVRKMESEGRIELKTADRGRSMYMRRKIGFVNSPKGLFPAEEILSVLRSRGGLFTGLASEIVPPKWTYQTTLKRIDYLVESGIIFRQRVNSDWTFWIVPHELVGSPGHNFAIEHRRVLERIRGDILNELVLAVLAEIHPFAFVNDLDEQILSSWEHSLSECDRLGSYMAMHCVAAFVSELENIDLDQVMVRSALSKMINVFDGKIPGTIVPSIPYGCVDRASFAKMKDTSWTAVNYWIQHLGMPTVGSFIHVAEADAWLLENPPKQIPPSDAYISQEEFGRITGLPVSTVYTIVRKGLIPSKGNWVKKDDALLYFKKKFRPHNEICLSG